MTTIPTTVQQRVPMPIPAPMGTQAAAAGKAVTPGDILAMLKQRLVTIIILSILFVSAGIGLFFLAYFKFPSYSALSYIEVISNAPKAQMSIQDETIQQEAYLRFIKSQALFLKSDQVLRQVLRDPAVRGTNWFKNTPQDERLLGLEKELGCSEVRDTTYLAVSMSTRSPGDPHKIVNVVVNTYLNQVRDRASLQYRQELTDYKQELAEVKKQIQEKQEQIQRFGADIMPGERPDRSGSGQGILAERLKQEQELVTQLEMQHRSLQSLKEAYTRDDADITPDDRMQVEADQRVAQLQAQVTSLEQEINILQANLGPNHRETKSMQARLDSARQQLERRRTVRLREVIQTKREQLETSFVNTQDALLLAKEHLSQTQAQQADLERKLADYYALEEELDLLVQTRDRIDAYIREIERIVKERGAIRVELAVNASEPKQRSFPSIVMLPLVVIAGFAMAVGLGIGLELIDTSVRTPQDIVRHVSVPMLGSVPDVDDEEVEIEQVESAVRFAPHSMITEAFRTIRSNLQFSAPAERTRTILVTSPRPEDGKTSVASNLAASLAVGGRRVLLVDGNLRRPALHRFYPQIDGSGMTNLLIGEAKLSDCIRATDLSNLDVVGCGPVPPNPAELLGGDLFREFLVEAAAKYDHVIIDSPPVLLASDAAVVATRVDGVILVCRARDNSRGVVQRARSLLEHVGAHIFGAVLNAARVQRGGYFREQLRTFYEYRSEDEPDDRARRALPQNGGKAEGPGDSKDRSEVNDADA